MMPSNSARPPIRASKSFLTSGCCSYLRIAPGWCRYTYNSRLQSRHRLIVLRHRQETQSQYLFSFQSGPKFGDWKRKSNKHRMTNNYFLSSYIARRASRWTGADVMIINSLMASPSSGQMSGESMWPGSYKSRVMTPFVVSRGFITVEFDFGGLDCTGGGFIVVVVVVVVVVFSTLNDNKFKTYLC